MTVSVIIPHYMDLDNLERALESVNKQDYMPLEIILINDGGGLCLLPSYYEKINAKINVVNLDENTGAGSARNIGVSVAKGKYVAFLDSDDYWHKSKLGIQYKIMEKYNVNLSAHDYLENDKLPDRIESIYKVKNRKYSELLIKSYIHTPTVMVRREGFLQFPIKLRRCEDMICWVINMQKTECFYIYLQLARGFKGAIGVSGLTQNFQQMHISYLEALKYLLEENFISHKEFIVSYLFEKIKYPIRRMIK